MGDGYDCVVKMYTKHQDDDKNILQKRDFDRKGKAAIKRELEEYREIIGGIQRNIWC
jgi:hypothetical protein